MLATQHVWPYEIVFLARIRSHQDLIPFGLMDPTEIQKDRQGWILQIIASKNKRAFSRNLAQ